MPHHSYRQRYHPERITVSLPLDLRARLDLALRPITLSRAPYGARSALISGLLELWLRDPSIFSLPHIEEPQP